MATNASLDTAVILSFSLVSALFISLIPLLSTIYKTSLSSSMMYGIMLLILPIACWGITSLFNVFIQMIRCGSINPSQVLINGVPTIFFVGFLGSISYFISILRYPIEVILPLWISEDMKKGIAVSFFIFWGAVYGQAFGGSLSQSCGL